MTIGTTQRIYVDLNEPNNYQPIVIRQYDKNSRLFEIIITDSNSIYSIPNNITVKIQGKKQNGETFDEPCALSNNLITYLASENFTSISGKNKCELQLYEPDIGGDDTKDRVIYSSTFEVIIDKSVMVR